MTFVYFLVHLLANSRTQKIVFKKKIPSNRETLLLGFAKNKIINIYIFPSAQIYRKIRSEFQQYFVKKEVNICDTLPIVH